MSADLVKLLRRPYGNLTGAERLELADRIEALTADLAAATARAEAEQSVVKEAVGVVTSLMRFVENTEGEWGIILGSADKARAFLAKHGEQP